MKEIETHLKYLIDLVGLDEDDYSTLKKYTDKTKMWADEFAKKFVDAISTYEPTREIFYREGIRLPEIGVDVVKKWYIDVTSGNADRDFWRLQYLIGLVHLKHGVENSFRLGMMSVVQQLFLMECLKELDKDEAVKLFLSFKKVTDVISGITAEGYFPNLAVAIQRTTGITKQLMDKMVSLEIDALISEARSPS
jgi:hypothetical protein